MVRAPALAPAVLPSVAAGSTSVKAVLEVGVSVTGSVADETGTALTGVGGNLQLLTEPGGLQLVGCNLKSDGTFEFKNVPSNQTWKISGHAWAANVQYSLTHAETLESGATDVKVVAKPSR